MVGVLLIAAVQLLANFLPGRLTPFGPPDDDAGGLVLPRSSTLAISLFIANGLRKGYRWAWWVAVVLRDSAGAAWLALVIVLAVIVASSTPDADIESERHSAADRQRRSVPGVPGRADPRAAARSGCRAAANAGWPPARSNADTAKELLRRWGGSTISWMTTWPENRHMITADGQSYIAFRKHAGVAIALGDPVGPPGAAAATINDFIALCDSAGDGARTSSPAPR